MKFDLFLIPLSASLHDALLQIESNHHGMVFLTDTQNAVCGVATDGDIRRLLLDGGSLEQKIKSCANFNFVWATPDTPRELLLKKLDHKIRVIPLLDSARKLVGIVSRDHIPVLAEGAVFARARAPVRISFGGGGSDLTDYFSDQEVGAVINATISLYSHATLRVRDDKRVFIRSKDLCDEIEADDLLKAVTISNKFGLIQSLLKAIQPEFGFELDIYSDFPIGSGLGGSAAVSAAILGCFNQFRRDQWDLHELSEISYQAERHYLDVAGGWQDQYATVFGGFNFMEFRLDQNVVHPLRIHPNTLLELEECLILCDTHTDHNSGEIHQAQSERLSCFDGRKMLAENVQLSYSMRNDLLRGRLTQFGHSLDKAWEIKRRFSNKISSPYLDGVYSTAKAHGAIGGKLLGAGGGGFFLFYVSPFRRHELMMHLENSGLGIQPFRFEPNGLQAWTVRQYKNS